MSLQLLLSSPAILCFVASTVWKGGMVFGNMTVWSVSKKASVISTRLKEFENVAVSTEHYMTSAWPQRAKLTMLFLAFLTVSFCKIWQTFQWLYFKLELAFKVNPSWGTISDRMTTCQSGQIQQSCVASIVLLEKHFSWKLRITRRL